MTGRILSYVQNGGPSELFKVEDDPRSRGGMRRDKDAYSDENALIEKIKLRGKVVT